MRAAPLDRIKKQNTPAAPRRRRPRLRHAEKANGVSPRELTPRQRETLMLVAEGHSTKEIAFSLGVSVKTVETHRALLKERLGIHNVAGLVRYALRLGLISA